MPAVLDRVLEVRPAWVRRAWTRLLAAIEDDECRRRRWLTAVVAAWILTEWMLPCRQVVPVRRLLLAMVLLDSLATYVWVSAGIAVEANPVVAAAMELYGDGAALALRTLWSMALVIVLTWIAQRRAGVRAALLIPVIALGGVTVLHMTILARVWVALLAT